MTKLSSKCEKESVVEAFATQSEYEVCDPDTIVFKTDEKDVEPDELY